MKKVSFYFVFVASGFCIFSMAACLRGLPNTVNSSRELNGFTASLSCEECVSELDFSNPPDFRARTKCHFEDLDPQITISTTDPSDQSADKIFQLIEKGRVQKAGNNAYVYYYKEITEREIFPYDLAIWTDIKKLSDENTEYMGVDKIPFSIAVLIGPEGISTTPLNNDKSPESEWIKCQPQSN